MIPQSRRRWSKSTIRSIILSTGIVWLMCFLLTSFLILGGGIVPVHPYVLGLSQLLIAVTYSVIATAIPRRRILTPLAQTILLLLCFVSTVRLFGYFVDNAFVHAKRYGAAIALSALDHKKQTGHWPQSLLDIPANAQPHLRPSDIAPYTCRVVPGEEHPSVGGFSIYYHADKDTPYLTVERRDMGVRWNWAKTEWESMTGYYH